MLPISDTPKTSRIMVRTCSGVSGSYSARDPPTHRNPERSQRQRRISALVDHLLSLSATGPLCVVVEDLHWLDPTPKD